MNKRVVSIVASAALLAGLTVSVPFDSEAASSVDPNAISVSELGGPQVFSGNIAFDPYWYALRHLDEFAALGSDENALYSWFLSEGRMSDPLGVNPMFYGGNWRFDMLACLDDTLETYPNLENSALFALEDLTGDGIPEMILESGGITNVILSSARKLQYTIINGTGFACNKQLGLFTYTDSETGEAKCDQAVDGTFIVSDAFAACTDPVPAGTMTLSEVTMELTGNLLSSPDNYYDHLTNRQANALSEVSSDLSEYDGHVTGTNVYYKTADCLNPNQIQMAADAWNLQPEAIRSWLTSTDVEIMLSGAQMVTGNTAGFSHNREYIVLAVNHDGVNTYDVCHEIGHQVDTGFYKDSGNDTWVSKTDAWVSLYNTYRDVIATFGVHSYLNVYTAQEAFAESWALYTTNPAALQSKCPDIYNFLTGIAQ